MSNKGIGRNTTQSPYPSGNNYLLAIGINAYTNGVFPLNNARKDAEQFFQLLTGKYQFESAQGEIVVDDEATRRNILNRMRHYLRIATNEDNVLFYFSGHGVQDDFDQQGYWLPSDAESGDPSTYISNSVIRDLIKPTKARHVFGIVDACFSGAFFRKAGVEHREAVSRFFALPSRWIMTSGLTEVVPDGLPGHHSPFAESLLTQLEYNNRPAMSLNELWVLMRDGVMANSQQTPRFEPLQNIGHQGGEFFFLKKGVTADQELPPPKPPTQEGAKERSQTPVPPEPEPVPNLTSIDGIRQHVKKLAAQGKTKEALNLLEGKLSEGSSLKNLVYSRYGAFNDLERQKMAGSIAQDYYTVEMARIRESINYIADQMEERDLA